MLAVGVVLALALMEGAAADEGEAKGIALGALVLEFRQDGVRQSPQELQPLYDEACRAGYALACQPGRWREDGLPDLPTAGRVFGPACRGGDTHACVVFSWASMAPDPRGKRCRYRRGLRALERACSAGLPRGCGELGHRLRGLDGPPEDPVRAERLLHSACEGGCGNSCSMWGNVLAEGEAGPPDLAGAHAAFLRACDLGDTLGCMLLAHARIEGRGTSGDPEGGLALLDEACDAGLGAGCNLLMQYHAGVRGLPAEPSLALDAALRACEVDELVSCALAAHRLQTGQGTPQDPERADAVGDELLAAIGERDDLDASFPLHALAGLRRIRGELDEAERLYRRVLAIREARVGTDDPRTCLVRGHLADLLSERGTNAAALDLALRNLSEVESSLGAFAPATADALIRVARLQRDLGDDGAAIASFGRALEIRSATADGTSTAVPDLHYDLAQLHETRGGLDAAVYHLEMTIKGWETSVGFEHLGVAATWNKLGLLQRTRGRLEAAMAAFERALSIRETVLGTDHELTAQALNNLATCHLDLGDPRSAAPLLARAIATWEVTLESGHETLGSGLTNLGGAQRQLGELEEAEASLQRALAIREARLDPSDPAIARTLNALALVHQDRNDHAAAEPLLRRANSIAEVTLGSDDLEFASVHTNLASSLLQLGRHREAMPMLQRALTVREARLPPDHPDIAHSLREIATLHGRRAEPDLAVPLLERALAIQSAAFGDAHEATVTTLSNLAVQHHWLGDNETAIPLAERALAAAEALYGEVHPDTANAMVNLAKMRFEAGDGTAAIPMLKRVIEVQSREDVLDAAHVLLQVLRHGGHAEAALPHAEWLLSHTESTAGPDHLDTVGAMNQLALLRFDSGDVEGALELMLRCLSIQETKLSPHDPNLGTTWNNLAVSWRTLGRSEDALQAMARALDIEEAQLTRVFSLGSTNQRRSFLARIADSTEVAISMHMCDAPDDPVATELALRTVLRRKGRLIEAESGSLRQIREGLDADGLADLAALQDSVSELDAVTRGGPGSGGEASWVRRIKELESEVERLERSVARRSLRFAVDSAPITIEAIARHLPEEGALLELFVYRPFVTDVSRYERWGEPRYVGYLLTPQGEITSSDLGPVVELDALVHDLRRVIMEVGDVRGPGQRLEQRLLAPFADSLEDVSHLVVAPDGQLSLVPWDALVGVDGRFLCETRLITMLTCGRDLLRMGRDAVPRSAPLVVADVDFSFSPADVTEGVTTGEAAGGRRERCEGPWASLPGTAVEAKALLRHLPSARLLSGAAATETALRGVQAPALLHVATHGCFMGDSEGSAGSGRGARVRPSLSAGPAPQSAKGALEMSPLLRSGIILAGANHRREGADNGFLTAAEASGLDLLGTRLAVLSACDTGLGDVSLGDGVQGLRRSLVLAGAEAQVLSLWKVHDEATAMFMAAFYERLAAGQPRGEALRSTRLSMLGTPETSHPFTWAAFVLSGDWSALPPDTLAPPP